MQIEKKTARHVQWDQEKLKQTEKYRGKFQKIDQPKTPYQNNSESDEQQQNREKSEQEIALDANLKAAKKNSQENCHKRLNIAELNAQLTKELQKSNNSQDMVDEDEENERKRREEFKKKRAQHYNQFNMIKKMRQQKQEDE